MCQGPEYHKAKTEVMFSKLVHLVLVSAFLIPDMHLGSPRTSSHQGQSSEVRELLVSLKEPRCGAISQSLVHTRYCSRQGVALG